MQPDDQLASISPEGLT
ncbi:hypothetical protein R2601_20836 [Salipiger bermudensis HTCC2601]|uniref:Uncharacterized protein n=1 Tax=Salipiger bermudensis (strain DSM 26914 / JCM 13377 / KCTC 12554 / HTCC2601) TaxID=314265 RepID=Q0FT72_SALBH|nr:hypothetical protein R2601_20836 [Salipiger bermudensis HTCC2601]